METNLKVLDKWNYEPTGPRESDRIELDRSHHDTSAWSFIVVGTNGFLTLVLIVGMALDGRSIFLSLVVGALYYAFTTMAAIVISSGQAGILWRTWQQEKTERQRIDSYEYLAERKMELEAMAHNRLPPPPAPPQESQAPNFVPAYLPATIKEAEQWAYSLYGSDGQLKPNRVKGGYIQGKIIGSKRGEGSPAAKQFLINHRIIKPKEGGYMLNRHLPHLEDMERFFLQVQGRPG